MVQKEIIESNLYSVDIRTFTHELVNLLNEGWGDAEVCIEDDTTPLRSYKIIAVKDELTTEKKIILKSK